MERKFSFWASFARLEGGKIGVNFPDLPGCFTEGADSDEAEKNAKDVLALYLASTNERGLEIPAPTRKRELGACVEIGSELRKIDVDLAEFFPERFPERRGGKRDDAGRKPKKADAARTGARLLFDVSPTFKERFERRAAEFGATKVAFLRRLLDEWESRCETLD